MTMKQVLGLDMGSNSIAWALIKNNQTESSGVLFFTSGNRREGQKYPSDRTALWMNFSVKTKIAAGILVSLVVLTFVDHKNWKFWISSVVPCLMNCLTQKE